jgi:hypothetical protein
VRASKARYIRSLQIVGGPAQLMLNMYIAWRLVSQCLSAIFPRERVNILLHELSGILKCPSPKSYLFLVESLGLATEEYMEIFQLFYSWHFKISCSRDILRIIVKYKRIQRTVIFCVIRAKALRKFIRNVHILAMRYGNKVLKAFGDLSPSVERAIEVCSGFSTVFFTDGSVVASKVCIP